MLLSEREMAPVADGLANSQFLRDVLAGLQTRPRAIPARWFYDRRGSELFEAITELPEYYPSRTERALLAEHGKEIAAIAGAGRVVVEFGSGSSAKTPLLLSAIEPAAYIPIDISGDFLRESAAALGRSFPSLRIQPLEADFTGPLSLPAAHGAPRLGFFPGSTIGNLVAPAAVDLLRAMAGTLGESALLLIGIDRVKDDKVLVPAYNDASGVTAAFNLNLLHRINRELEGTVPVKAFEHLAHWNDFASRIEMHLRATKDVQFTVAGRPFSLKKGETLHTENSIKYGPRDARVLLRDGGWEPVAEWSDRESLFSLILAAASPMPSAP